MFEKIEKTAQRVLLAIVVILLCTVFALQFGGPQADGCTQNLRKVRYAAKVYRQTITEGEFRANYTLQGFSRYPAEDARMERLREKTVDALVERALLARAARKMGFSVNDDDVMRRFTKDGTMLISKSIDAGYTGQSGPVKLPVLSDSGEFDKEGARKLIQYHLRRSIQEFTESQIEEMLAERMRQAVQATVGVGEREVWEAYAWDNDKRTVRYAKFSPTYYRDTMDISPSTLAEWQKTHAKEIDAAYEKRKSEFTKLPEQVRARHILIKLESSASEDDQKAAEQKALAIVKRLRKGEDFGAVARKESGDTGSARKGGDLGWNAKGRMVDAFDKVQFELAQGQISDPVKTQFGYHIIEVLGRRKGDVAIEAARTEIASDLYREQKSEELAKNEAQRVMAALKRGESWESLVPAEAEDALAPKAEKAEAFSRASTPVTGSFSAGEWVQKAFALTQEKPMPDAPIKLGDTYFAMQLESAAPPSEKDYEARKVQIRNELLQKKRTQALEIFVRSLRKQAEEDDAIAINPSVLRYEQGGES